MGCRFVFENTSERARLNALVDLRTDNQLTLKMKNGWTIAGILAHPAAGARNPWRRMGAALGSTHTLSHLADQAVGAH